MCRGSPVNAFFFLAVLSVGVFLLAYFDPWLLPNPSPFGRVVQCKKKTCLANIVLLKGSRFVGEKSLARHTLESQVVSALRLLEIQRIGSNSDVWLRHLPNEFSLRYQKLDGSEHVLQLGPKRLGGRSQWIRKDGASPWLVEAHLIDEVLVTFLGTGGPVVQERDPLVLKPNRLVSSLGQDLITSRLIQEEATSLIKIEIRHGHSKITWIRGELLEEWNELSGGLKGKDAAKYALVLRDELSSLDVVEYGKQQGRFFQTKKHWKISLQYEDGLSRDRALQELLIEFDRGGCFVALGLSPHQYGQLEKNKCALMEGILKSYL